MAPSNANNLLKIKTTPFMQQPDDLIVAFTQALNKYERKILPDLLKEHPGLSPAKFKHICITEIRKSNGLREAFIQSPLSLFGSILFLAEVGIAPDEQIGEGFLIPYYNKDTGKKEAKPIIGYPGVVKILYRSNKISYLETAAVFEGDKFTYKHGLNADLEHIPNHDVPRNSSTFKYAYAIAQLDTGKSVFRVMSKAEIESVRDMARSVNKLFFNDKSDPNYWMPQKTALKQLAKLLPKDFYGSKALQYDGYFEAGGGLTIGDDGKMKLIEGASVKPKRFRDIYGTLGGDDVTDQEIPDDAQ